jgi:hypothetical protein
MDRIRSERQRLRSFPNFKEDNKDKNDNSDKDDSSGKDIEKKFGEIQKELVNIDKFLEELKRNEPSSDNKLFRLSIIAYEIGDLHRAIAYAARFKDDDKAKIAYLANGKLALADALTQLYLLCLSLEWDFNQLRELGALHLQERHEDFKRDGWSEIL